MRKFFVGVLIVVVTLAGLFVGYVYITNRPLPQNEHDVAILERTLELLASPDAWSKSGDRNCEPEDAKLNLYCALRRASLDVSGDVRHRAAAMQQVRHSIQEVMPGRDYAHRLMDFNNDADVAQEDVHRVLHMSIAALERSGVATP